VAKIEAAIKDAIVRGARRQVREATLPLRRDLRRLRRVLTGLRRDLAALRDVAGHWQRMSEASPWRPEVSDTEFRSARLSPRLIRKLRVRLGVSQAALARLAGVSTGAVTQWERGRSVPSGQNRRALVALRKLGRRDVRRLLAGSTRSAPARKRRPRRRGARRARKTRRTR
jgi:DNA-binding transcriptional regulator YiaG